MSTSTEPFKLKVAVYVLLRRDDEILLAKRANTGYQDGNYGLPAGHLNGNELATSGVIREAKEEIDVDIDVNDLKLVHVTHKLDTGISSERVELIFECRKWQGEPRNAEPHKCDEVAWFAMSSLPANMIPLVRRVVELSDKGIVYSEYPFEPM